MRRLFILLITALLAGQGARAQATDKHGADRLIYSELTAAYDAENWHENLVITRDMLADTQEKDLYIVRGDSFQVKSIRSDFYVKEKDGQWTVVDDARYPLETLTNLLLNRIADNRHTLEARHHQYGGEKPRVVIPMQKLFDLLARSMKLYCSVTAIGKEEIRAVLILHQQKMDFIHMLEIKAPVEALADPQSTFFGELYTNIPQENVKSIYRERNQFLK